MRRSAQKWSVFWLVMPGDPVAFMRERIEEAIGGRSRALALEESTGGRFSRSTLQRWIDGKTSPTVPELVELGRLTGRPLSFFLSLDADVGGAPSDAQLRTLVGSFPSLADAQKHLDAEKEEPDPALLLALTEKFHVSMEFLLGLSDDPSPSPATRRDIGKMSSSIMFKPVRRLDVHASAGAGAVNHGFTVDAMLPFPRWMLQKLGATSAKLSFLRARGDSMEPTIKNGALLLVDEGDVRLRFPPPKAESPWSHPDIYVFSRGDELRVKHLRRDKTKGLLFALSDHPAYEAEILSEADIKIEGRVIWWDNRL